MGGKGQIAADYAAVRMPLLQEVLQGHLHTLSRAGVHTMLPQSAVLLERHNFSHTYMHSGEFALSRAGGADLQHDVHLPRSLQVCVFRPPKGILC